MKVKVFAPPFSSFKNIDENGYMDLKENATLRDVFRELKILLISKPLLVINVNYKKAGLYQKLKDGDIVSCLYPLHLG